MVVPPTSDFVATPGIGAAGSSRSDNDRWAGDNDLIVRNPSALQTRPAVLGWELLSTKKLVKATAFLARSQYCYQCTSLYGQ